MRSPVSFVTLIYIAFFLSLVPPALGVVVTSWLRQRRARRAAAHRAAERKITPMLIEALSVDAEVAGIDATATKLIGLSRRMGTELELLVTPLIASLRGVERARLITILQYNGSIARAVRQTRSRRAWRRLAAVEFLGAVGNPALAEVLLDRLHDRSSTVRQAAIRALGRVGAVDAVPRMLNRLAGGGRRQVPPHTVAMSVLRCGSGAITPLVDSLNHPSLQVRDAAVDLLGWLGAAQAAQDLRAVADSGLQPAAGHAAQALARIGIPHPPRAA